MSAMKTNLSFRSRIIGAGLWVLGGHAISQALRLGGNLIMTRLLVPEMFGVMAVAMVFYIGLILFSDLGLRQNIIQSGRGADPVFLNTAWTVQIIRGGVIWLMAIGLAIVLQLTNDAGMWPAESTYSEPILPYVISAIAFNAVIIGFESTKLATAGRNLSLGIVTRIELVSQFVAILSMITWGLIDRSIWALVMGTFFGSAVKVILSHIVIPGLHNKLHWDHESFREIFSFGKWIFLASIMGFLVMNGDRLLLAGFVDARVLGLYAVALVLAQAIQQVFGKIIGSVAYPALSEVVRENPLNLKQVYYRFRTPIDVVLLFSTGLLYMSGHLLIEILYDDRYLEAGYMLEILSFALFMERFNLAEQCFLALGKPRLLIPIKVVQTIALFSLVPVMNVLFGLQGFLWAVASFKLFSLPLIFIFKKKYGLLDITREFILLPVLIIGVFVGYVLDMLLLMLGIG
jgi:O-antigen/teichoic acid export membrane protein